MLMDKHRMPHPGELQQLASVDGNSLGSHHKHYIQPVNGNIYQTQVLEN